MLHGHMEESKLLLLWGLATRAMMTWPPAFRVVLLQYSEEVCLSWRGVLSC